VLKYLSDLYVEKAKASAARPPPAPAALTRQDPLFDWPEGKVEVVNGGGGKTYTLVREGVVVRCDCAGWAKVRQEEARRTCKHVVALRGDARERARVGEEGYDAYLVAFGISKRG
jgi:hypothetical protein